VASSLAAGQAMPFAKGDVAIDAVPTSAEIEHALSKLEDIALPVSIDRIAAWSKGLEARGILLVPLTSAVLKSKSS